jgi:hypothetical protein
VKNSEGIDPAKLDAGIEAFWKSAAATFAKMGVVPCMVIGMKADGDPMPATFCTATLDGRQEEFLSAVVEMFEIKRKQAGGISKEDVIYDPDGT